jgi:Uma2 family endonuclease
LIEIADATLKCDRTHKAKLYAQTNVPEYWVIDINQRQLIVFRDPQDRMYQSEAVLTATDRIAPVAFPDVAIELQNLLIAYP